MLDFIITVLAVFRLTELVTKDNGPYDVFATLRAKALQNEHKNKTYKTISDAVTCPYCMSVWFSLFIWLIPKQIRYLLGVAGATSIIETLAGR